MAALNILSLAFVLQTFYRHTTEAFPVSEMTYAVSSGTLNSTIPYQTEASSNKDHQNI